MTGSPTTKTFRLIAHLVAQPRYLIPYLGTNVLGQTSTLELELPWISYAAIDFLKGFVTKHMSVFEYGSGGSTLFFARRTTSVITIEDDAVWVGKVRQRIDQSGLTNVDLRHRPFDFKRAVDFARSPYLNSIPDTKFDIILVDGTEELIPVRPQCFHHAEDFIREGGIIVVDDSWRYESLRSAHRAKRVEIFQSVGPGRPGVTSTDVFFY